MWLDETFSVWLAKHSMVDMLHWIVKIDQHPPLYYLLLHYWIALNGDTPYYVRLLSALFGAGTIPIIYLIGKRISGAVTGLVAALLMALSPFNIRFAQDTRMYTLLAFNAAVAIYALVRLLTDARSIRPIGSQFREYLHAWRTPGPVEPDTKEDFSYKDMSPQSNRMERLDIPPSLVTHPGHRDRSGLGCIYRVFGSDHAQPQYGCPFPIRHQYFRSWSAALSKEKEQAAASPAFQAPSLGNWVKAQIGIFILWSPWLFAFIKQASASIRSFGFLHQAGTRLSMHFDPF